MIEVGHTKHLNNTTMVKAIRRNINNNSGTMFLNRITSTSRIITDITNMEVTIMEAMIRGITTPTKISTARDKSNMSTRVTTRKMDTMKVVFHLGEKASLKDHQHSMTVVEVILETDEVVDRHSRGFWNLQFYRL